MSNCPSRMLALKMTGAGSKLNGFFCNAALRVRRNITLQSHAGDMWMCKEPCQSLPAWLKLPDIVRHAAAKRFVRH